jgi:hypothetical protein
LQTCRLMDEGERAREIDAVMRADGANGPRARVVRMYPRRQ